MQRALKPFRLAHKPASKPKLKPCRKEPMSDDDVCMYELVSECAIDMFGLCAYVLKYSNCKGGQTDEIIS